MIRQVAQIILSGEAAPGDSCATCNQTERGCQPGTVGKGKWEKRRGAKIKSAPHVPSIRLRRCPKAILRDNPEVTSMVLLALDCYELKVLPHAGGLLEQPASYVKTQRIVFDLLRLIHNPPRRYRNGTEKEQPSPKRKGKRRPRKQAR